MQITPYPPLPRKRSPDGATDDYGGGYSLAAYYLYINPERMKGWVGLVYTLYVVNNESHIYAEI